VTTIPGATQAKTTSEPRDERTGLLASNQRESPTRGIALGDESIVA
jgi:hypothetical protein